MQSSSGIFCIIKYMLISRGVPFEIAFFIFVGIILVFLAINIPASIGLKKSKRMLRRLLARLRLLKSARKLLAVVYKIKPLRNLRQRFRVLPVSKRKLVLLVFDAMLIGVGLYLSYDLFVYSTNVKYSSPLDTDYWGYEQRDIEVIFDHSFNQGVLIPKMQPEVKGNWEVKPGIIPFLPRKLVFHPEESILPGEKIIIYVANVSNIFGHRSDWWDKIIETNSAPIPEIDLEKTTPKQGEAKAPTDTEVKFELSSFDGDFVDWQFQVTPAVDFDVVRDKSANISLKFKQPLAQNTPYKVKVSRTIQAINYATQEVILEEDPVVLGELAFTTLKAPVLAGSEPTGDKVRAEASIKLVFDKPMVQKNVDENLRIEPAVEATKSWLDDKTILLKPNKPLEKGVTYKVIIPKGTKSVDGGALEADIVHQFSTIGAVKVRSTSPGNSARNVSATTQIKIEFDQEVDHGSAQSKFSVQPHVGGNFSWSGNTLIYSGAKFGFSTKYTVKIASGVKTVHGLDSNADHVFSFTTRPQQIVLNVPVYIQPYRFACNITAASMALAYKGKSVSVDTLYSQIAKDNTPYNADTNTWGNPNSGYVGDIRGNAKGYGVHWGPTASLISKYRGATVKTGWNLADLLREVEAGNPVIIWAHNGYGGSGSNTSWNLPGGGTVYTVKGMHSYVVKGFIGSPESPSKIIVNDPGRGVQNMSPSYFNSLWGTFGRAAVIVK